MAEQLTPELLESIAEYILDPKSLCSLLASFKAWKNLGNEDKLWKKLYENRGYNDDLRIEQNDKDEYKRRYALDHLYLQVMGSYNIETEDRSELDRIRKFEHENICRTILEDERTIEIIFSVKITNVHKMLAASTVVQIRKSRNLVDFHRRAMGMREETQRGAREEDHRLLEEALFCLSRTQQDWRSYIDESWGGEGDARRYLDQLGEEYKERLEREKPDDNERSFELLKDLLNGHGFTGNREDYYNVNNSLLTSIMQQKTGIPLSLAIVFKLVAARAGITVLIVGLPGHIVVTLPNSNFFYDVFNGGERMDEDGARTIVSMYNIEWDDSYRSALDSHSVVQRVLNNMMNAEGRRLMNTGRTQEVDRLTMIAVCDRLLSDRSTPRSISLRFLADSSFYYDSIKSQYGFR